MTVPGAVLSGPVEPEEFTVYTVTPGLIGFVWFFILALAGWLLFRSMARHMRRVDHNARRRAGTSGAVPGGPGDGPPGGGTGRGRPEGGLPDDGRPEDREPGGGGPTGAPPGRDDAPGATSTSPDQAAR